MMRYFIMTLTVENCDYICVHFVYALFAWDKHKQKNVKKFDNKTIKKRIINVKKTINKSYNSNDLCDLSPSNLLYVHGHDKKNFHYVLTGKAVPNFHNVSLSKQVQ